LGREVACGAADRALMPVRASVGPTMMIVPPAERRQGRGPIDRPLNINPLGKVANTLQQRKIAGRFAWTFDLYHRSARRPEQAKVASKGCEQRLRAKVASNGCMRRLEAGEGIDADRAA